MIIAPLGQMGKMHQNVRRKIFAFKFVKIYRIQEISY